MRAAKLAIQLQKQYLRDKVSFSQETTLSGRTILKTLKDAKQLGYKIIMYFVGLEGAELAKERIRIRVAQGLHYIPDSVVEERYVKTLINLAEAMKVVDEAFIYDNTIFYELKVIYLEGNYEYINDNVPRWLIQALPILSE